MRVMLQCFAIASGVECLRRCRLRPKVRGVLQGLIAFANICTHKYADTQRVDFGIESASVCVFVSVCAFCSKCLGGNLRDEGEREGKWCGCGSGTHR